MNYKSVLVLLVLCVLLVACGASSTTGEDNDIEATPVAKRDLWVNCPGIMNDFIVCRDCTRADVRGTAPKSCSYELR